MQHSRITKLWVAVPHKYTDGWHTEKDSLWFARPFEHRLFNTIPHKIAFVLVGKKFYRYMFHICISLSFQIICFQNWLPTSEIFPHENCFMINPTRVLPLWRIHPRYVVIGHHPPFISAISASGPHSSTTRRIHWQGVNFSMVVVWGLFETTKDGMYFLG